MSTRLCFAVVMAVLLVLAGCGGSKKSLPGGSVEIVTTSTRQHTVTYRQHASSMEPTILCASSPVVPGCTGTTNDRLVVEEPPNPIRRLDIIVFKAPREAVLKCGEAGTFLSE